MGTIALMWVTSFAPLLSLNVDPISWIIPTSQTKSTSSPLSRSATRAYCTQKDVRRFVELKLSPQSGWNILVNKHPIFNLANPIEAAIAFVRLNTLAQRLDLDPNSIQPFYNEGRYHIQIGSDTLFVLPSDGLVNPGLTLTERVNKLRVAMGAKPLTLLEAQERMYRLVSTNRNLEGLASWYGPYFHGKMTASGEIFEQSDFTAAHPDLPFNTYLKVTNTKNGASVVVRINDRGPYVKPRVLDLSYAAAKELGSEHSGVIAVQATVMAQN